MSVLNYADMNEEQGRALFAAACALFALMPENHKEAIEELMRRANLPGGGTIDPHGPFVVSLIQRVLVGLGFASVIEDVRLTAQRLDRPRPSLFASTPQAAPPMQSNPVPSPTHDNDLDALDKALDAL